MTTNQKGRIAELIAMARYIELGYTVLEPVNKDGIYDFVIEVDGNYKKIQVKTLNDKGNYYELNVRSVTHNTKCNSSKYYTKRDVDIMVGVDINNKDVFAISIEECKTVVTLRKTASKNGQQKGVRLAQDYKI